MHAGKNRSASEAASRRHFRAVLSGLLAALAPFAGGSKVWAGDILRGGSTMNSSPAAGAAGGGQVSGAQTAAAARAQDALARNTQAVQAVKAMQSAAQKAARVAPMLNLGQDPNHPGQLLPNVPNGLAPGGLQVAPGVPANLAQPAPGDDASLWQGAKLPRQTTANGRTVVGIEQTKPTAVLNWKTFNVGSRTTVSFNQSAGGKDAGSWIAFNKINDPSGVPSQILGSITAPGQVYLINRNGIIFGAGSQINLHTLVASALPINNGLIARGLLNNPDAQFLFSALPQTAGANGTPAFTPEAALTPSGKYGDVTVQAGAQLTSPTTADHVGGRVALIGANVQNAGTISTPDGQTILAAGLQVGFSPHASSDATLRGLDVAVGAVTDAANKTYAGSVTNSGFIDAPRADTTIAGKNVSQLGVIQSTTSVSLNGRIDLLADYNAVSSRGAARVAPFLPKTSGVVTFGAGSMTAILPELSSDARVVGTQLALPSLVNVQGQAIHLATNSMLLAPGATAARDGSGNVTTRDASGTALENGINLNAGSWFYTLAGGVPVNNFVFSSGQIYLDSGATISAAGSVDVAAPMSENIVSVQLRGAELADSVLQRFGVLRGETIQIDVRQAGLFNGQAWIGTPLANAAGYVNLIERTAGELTTSGGTVKLAAGASVVMQRGATVDASGGWISYQGGQVETTRVISGGHILDISQATPDRIYDGIFTGTFTANHLKYGISEVFANPLDPASHYEAGYVFGGNGGAISISAPSMALDGKLLGSTIRGPRQRDIAPAPSQLSLAFESQSLAVQAQNLYPVYSPTPPTIVFQALTDLPAAAPFALDANGLPSALSDKRKKTVFLSPGLAAEFGNQTIRNSDGDIVIPADTVLQTAAGGSVTLSAKNLDIEGRVVAPSGTLNFTVYDITPYQGLANPLTTTPPADPKRGVFTLGQTASLSAAGLIVDDRAGARDAGNLPLSTAGGAVSINSYTANLTAGSVIDVSGGVALGPTGKAAYGNAGRISISAGQDPTISSLLGGKLVFGSRLEGFSGAKGGSLEIQASLIQIGGATADSGTLLLSPVFFSQGGFGSFALRGLGAKTGRVDQYVPGIFVAPGTVIAPVALSLLAVPETDGVSLSPVLLPQAMRTPVSLSLTAVGVKDPFNLTDPLLIRGDVLLGAGARILTDPKGGVSLGGDTVAVLGAIETPGGTITINGGQNSAAIFRGQTGVVPTVFLGSGSLLSSAGTVLLAPDPRGRGDRAGSVLPGGTITVSGNIVAEAGAILDVSGASGVLDLAPTASGLNVTLNSAEFPDAGIYPRTPGSLGITPVLSTYGVLGVNAPLNSSMLGSVLVPTRVDSDGGAIVLKGAQELFTDAALSGAAGGPSALGGSLTISSGRTASAGQTPLDVTLLVTQSGATIPMPGLSGIGKSVVDEHGNALPGHGYFAVDSFLAGGFDALTLRGTVEFSGPVTIHAPRSISVADGGALYANSAANLSAPYVKLGTAFVAPVDGLHLLPSAFQSGSDPFYFSPTFGRGVLTVTASLIDIGNLSLQNIGRANFIADGGDIRGDGTLDVAGSIFMRAGQIYPPTGVNFTIAAYDHGGVAGSVTFAGSGSRALPLSAGAELNVYASEIRQGGVLRAPLGTINLGWDGTGASPKDYISGAGFTPDATVAAAHHVTLLPGGVTSVSAVDPATGQALLIPFGINLNGTSWIDPMGVDITANGVPQKAINISAANVDVRSGSVIDLSGGGELFAYQWVGGNGGSSDILASSKSFAVIPGYDAAFQPFAPFNTNRPSGSDIAANLGSDPGYVNTTLSVGDRIYLDASKGLAAGNYTLLPARYALLPGAFLVTPEAGAPVGTVLLADGASLVPGFRFNGMGGTPAAHPLFGRFEIASSAVVAARSEYHTFFGGDFLREGALSHGASVPRLPLDAGHLVLSATQSMSLEGSIAAQSLAHGRGGLVDISSPVDIVITGAKTTASTTGQLVLKSDELSSIGAESLLIGGVRVLGADGTAITVKTGSLTVDNAGSRLSGQDIILVANEHLSLAAGADIEQTGGAAGGDDLLLLGNAAVPGSGDGVLLRVSGDAGARIVRAGVSGSALPDMTVGARARISGTSILLDSTHATTLDPSAILSGQSIALGSGQISLALANPGPLQPTTGLVLSGNALQTLQTSARSLSLLSYSTLDVYGTGQIGALGADGAPSLTDLALHAGEIRGFNNSGGAVVFSAKNITLDNSANALSPGPVAAQNGTLTFDASVIRLGAHDLDVDQFSTVTLLARGGVLAQGAGGFAAQGALAISAPLVTGMAGAHTSITAGGAITIGAPAAGGTAALVKGGLGASLAFTGASISANSDIILPSGALSLHATNGSVLVGNLAASRLDVGGTARTFFDLVKYTNGGVVNLAADGGSVTVAAGSSVSVAAAAGVGNGGTLSVSTPKGAFALAGTLHGSGGAKGEGGTFSLDAGALPSLAALDAALDAAAFTQARSFRARTGDVLLDGLATAQNFSLSADHGSINVTGTVRAPGGALSLVASGSVRVEAGAVLDVSASDFNHAGKGGSVSLEAGAEVNGLTDSAATVDIQLGSTINLSVASATADSAAMGKFTGTLHLRAPQKSGNTDVQISAIDGSILNASSIVVEGVQIFDASADGSIDNQEANVFANGLLFTGNAPAITAALLANNAGLASVLHIRPGAEIANAAGDLTLAADWDLSGYHFGANLDEPGNLTLRAKGNLNFNFHASLSDGFGGASNFGLWDQLLLDPGSASWSYRLVAGADFGAADARRVAALPALGAGSGSLLLGKDSPALPTGGVNDRTSVILNYFQTIRTGTGDIGIFAGRDVQLLNPLATIYTAGLQAEAMANFDTPNLAYSNNLLGQRQDPLYPAQYSLGGGDIFITAQNNIAHYNAAGIGAGAQLVADSTRELPTNWLYRRGMINPVTGLFGKSRNDDIASTSWWVDFSNFFEGVATLGGGNVTLLAGQDVSNVDAAVATNARMPKGAPSAAGLLELGGGDLVVKAGRDLDGGVYYVERGTGSIQAGGSIHSNSTRAALTQDEINNDLITGTPISPVTWMPTTLFAGKSSFSVSAQGDVLLGAIANPFLLPQGINNSYVHKSYFSTYAASDAVDVSSVTGDVTLKDSADGGAGSLINWYKNVQLFFRNGGSFSAQSQPWLRLAETSVSPFQTAAALMPGTLRATAFSGDINLVGRLTLSPAPLGTIDLAAARSINGVQANGINLATQNQIWGSSLINLSDASPSRVPGIVSPISSTFTNTRAGALAVVDTLFNESGSTAGSFGAIQTKLALHAPSLLHLSDPAPIHLYAQKGDISGLTLFSGKAARVIAGQDITDIAFYVQNVGADDTTVVSAGRDITAYNPNSPLRQRAQSAGNELIAGSAGTALPATGTPTAGDLQISGPGTLELLAGRNLDLGVGPNNPDGTAVGVLSIGNARNPALPFDGADIIAGAGLGGTGALSQNNLDFKKFISTFLSSGSPDAARYFAELNLGEQTMTQAAFEKLPSEEQARIALALFYIVLRDAGRDQGLATSPGFGTYTAGFNAIAALFPNKYGPGDISLTSREIKTKSGGNISLLAPGGGLTVGFDVAGTQPLDQGILTEDGGNISIFTNGSVTVGTSRIFTLRGGNEVIWSSAGDIAAGASSKTVQSAPPTRVLIDPQSGDVQTDLAGLATGGGIGVLDTVAGVPPGDVDLIAPAGTVDAGDAGIRVSGNINIAALQVLNATNIQVGGSSAGVPAVVAPSINLGSISAAANTAGSQTSTAQDAAKHGQQAPPPEEMPSLITVEVVGYGGEGGSGG